MTFIGMTIDAVYTAMNDLSQQAQALTAVRQRVDNRMDYASQNWYGPGINQYRNIWGACRADLSQAIDRLQSMSNELNRQIDAQEQVSSPDSQSGLGLSAMPVPGVNQPVGVRTMIPVKNVVTSTRTAFSARGVPSAWNRGLFFKTICPTSFSNNVFWRPLA